MWKARAAGSISLVESSSAQDGRDDSFLTALCGSGCDADGCVALAPSGGLAEAMAVSSSAAPAEFVYNLEEGESYTPKCDAFITDNICGTQEYTDPSSARRPRERRAECEEHDAEEEDIALAFATALDADADVAARLAPKFAPPLASSGASARGATQQHVVVFEAPSPAEGFAPVGASSSWWRKVDRTTREGGDEASDRAESAR
jgi:hypothetical protein